MGEGMFMLALTGGCAAALLRSYGGMAAVASAAAVAVALIDMLMT